MYPSTVLGIRCPDDLVLHHLAPIGLAAAAGTALVVDLDLDRPSYPGRLTLSDLLTDGPRRADLVPTRRGWRCLVTGRAATTSPPT